MLAIISDLHLQHTKDDVIRYRDVQRAVIHEVGVKRNVSHKALGLFFERIASIAERLETRVLHLVFDGDIFEIHRTPVWLWGGRLEPRPVDWPLRAPLRDRVLEVLGHIDRENKEFFKALRTFVEKKEYTWGKVTKTAKLDEVHVHFIPGNHDRLVNAWKATRQEVARMLAMASNGNTKFPRKLSAALEREYRVRVRHGQEYDSANFSVDPKSRPKIEFTEDEYMRPSLGDYLTVDFATRLAVAFRAYYAVNLRKPGKEGRPYRDLYLALTEFDDVRPQARVLDYLESGAHGADAPRMLMPAFRNVFEHADRDPFFRKEAKRQGISLTLFPVIREGIKHSSAILERVLRSLIETKGDAEGGPAPIAARETGLEADKIDTVVSGHTHEPEQVPLPSTEDDPTEPFYLNTGTWRTRIFTGEENTFGRLRGYTLVFCYNDAEAGSNKRRFETWTGHLANKNFGRYERSEPDPQTPPTQALRVTHCVVKSIDEGSSWFGSAEMRLRFGVDDQAGSFNKDGVRNNREYKIAKDFLLHPELDGELWCYGWEEDLGNSIIDKDDPLPFAIQTLPRDDNGFVECKSVLYLQDRGGTDIELHYAVEPRGP